MIRVVVESEKHPIWKNANGMTVSNKTTLVAEWHYSGVQEVRFCRRGISSLEGCTDCLTMILPHFFNRPSPSSSLCGKR